MIIHPTAIIDASAELGIDVEVGAHAYIGPHCRVGDETRIYANSTLQSHTTVGKNCQISPGAVLGGFPQDSKFKECPSYVQIGDNVIIRECVTVNRATGENEVTVIGDGCMLMAYAHVAHNCTVGQEVVLANSVQLGGHVEVGDYAFLGGIIAIHQFVKIGRLAIMGGGSVSRQDIPPFSMTDGRPSALVGINKVGLKRRGYDLASRTRLKKAFQLLWFSDLNQKQALQAIPNEIEMDETIQELLSFVENSTRGIRRPHKLMRNDRNRPLSETGASETMTEDLINV